MNKQITYNQALVLLEAKTHFVLCWFSVYGKDNLIRICFNSPMRLRMYLNDNLYYLERMRVSSCDGYPLESFTVDVHSVRESIPVSQMELFNYSCEMCYE